jgi:hypothetical protein
MKTTMNNKKPDLSNKIIKPIFVVRSKYAILAKKEFRTKDSIPLQVYLYASAAKNDKTGKYIYLLSMHFFDPATNTIKFSIEDKFLELDEYVVNVFTLPIMGIFPEDYEKEVLQFDGREMTIKEYQAKVKEWKDSLLK